MRALATWHRRPLFTLLVAWVIASATSLTLWVAAQAHSLEHGLNEMLYRLGATESSVHVDVLGGWPRLALVYAAVVLLPPLAVLGMWRRAARREASASVQAV